jgi:selenocysteine-specific elongation factor
MMLTEPGRFAAVSRIDCSLDLLPSAKPLKNRAPVHFHSAAAEVEAEVRLLESSGPMAPGTHAFVRILLRDPLQLLPGDRFIVRMFSPVVTIGGGSVVDITAHKYSRGEDATARLRTLAHGTPEERVALLVRESIFGLGVPELIAATGLMPQEIERVAKAESILALTEPRLWLVDREWFRATVARITDLLKAFHKERPLLPGMPKEELRSRQLPDAPAHLLDAIIARTAGIAAEDEIVRLPSHKVVLKQDEEQASGAIEKAFLDAGLAVPAVAEVLAKSGVEPARARSLLQILLRERRLVKVADDLVFHRSAIEALRERLAPHRGRRLSVPQFKDLAGISRKYAIPLLEYLDRERVTHREGDERLVL